MSPSEEGRRGFDAGTKDAVARLSARLEALRALADETEKRRAQAESEGRQFTALTSEQLEEKLRRARSPMIVWQSWSGSAPRGGSLSYDVGVLNPDPDPWIWLFAHVFTGRANLAPDVGAAVAACDTRFPQLTEPAFAGLSIPAGATSSFSFSIEIPPGVEATNYLGNSFLFQGMWHDPAIYLDRGLFVFAVT
jgi:hypothetical protein